MTHSIMASFMRYDLPFSRSWNNCHFNCCELTASVVGTLVWYDLHFQVFVQRALDHLGEKLSRKVIRHSVGGQLLPVGPPFQVFVQRALDHLEIGPETFVSYTIVASFCRYDLHFRCFSRVLLST